MKAFILDRYGKKGTLRFGSMPEPALGDDDVLVEIHAAGLSQLDSKIRDGEFKLILPYRLPLILGHDVAGTVVQVGSNVRQFKPGDEIDTRPRDGRIGTFAEFIAVNEADVAPKLKSLTMEEAASSPTSPRNQVEDGLSGSNRKIRENVSARRSHGPCRAAAQRGKIRHGGSARLRLWKPQLFQQSILKFPRSRPSPSELQTQKIIWKVGNSSGLTPRTGHRMANGANFRQT